jgi:hypothetical protein
LNARTLVRPSPLLRLELRALLWVLRLAIGNA